MRLAWESLAGHIEKHRLQVVGDVREGVEPNHYTRQCDYHLHCKRPYPIPELPGNLPEVKLWTP